MDWGWVFDLWTSLSNESDIGVTIVELLSVVFLRLCCRLLILLMRQIFIVLVLVIVALVVILITTQDSLVDFISLWSR